MVSSSRIDNPIDSSCTGSAGSTHLSAQNGSFAAGQEILIHQTQGVGAGQYERNVITAYSVGTITLRTALAHTYTTGAQALVLRQYTNVTVGGGVTWTAKAWNGSTGGILAFLASGTVSNSGTISANGRGYRGGQAIGDVGDPLGYQGEGTTGPGSRSYSANGTGGGGGDNKPGMASKPGGGGGGHATSGTKGTDNVQGQPGVGGAGGGTAGSADLSNMVFGGGGGSGGDSTNGLGAGAGGGIVFITAVSIANNGLISAVGSDGEPAGGSIGGAGGGAGGSILLVAQA